MGLIYQISYMKEHLLKEGELGHSSVVYMYKAVATALAVILE